MYNATENLPVSKNLYTFFFFFQPQQLGCLVDARESCSDLSLSLFQSFLILSLNAVPVRVFNKTSNRSLYIPPSFYFSCFQLVFLLYIFILLQLKDDRDCEQFAPYSRALGPAKERTISFSFKEMFRVCDLKKSFLQ